MLPLDVVDDGLGPGRRELAADAEDVVRDRRRVDGRAARALEGRRVQQVLEPGRGLARVRAVVAERVAVLLQLADAVRELARGYSPWFAAFEWSRRALAGRGSHCQEHMSFQEHRTAANLPSAHTQAHIKSGLHLGRRLLDRRHLYG